MASRSWCFTINNPEEEDLLWVAAIQCSYIVVGLEHADGVAGHTPHLQGYIEFPSPKRLATLHNQSPRAHFEARKGTAKQASEYCEKEGQIIRKDGTMSQQGKRTDLAIACEGVAAGISNRELATAHPTEYVKYHRGLQALRYALTEPRNPATPPTVIWLWGPTGVGKTRAAYTPEAYFKDNTQWWDGYTGQQRIIIDDFDYKLWDFRQLLRVLDRYPVAGQSKGGYVQINSPEIYITCEFPPEIIFTGTALEQVLRRINSIQQVTRPVTEVTADPDPVIEPIPDLTGLPVSSVTDVTEVTEVAGNTDRHF